MSVPVSAPAQAPIRVPHVWLALVLPVVVIVARCTTDSVVTRTVDDCDGAQCTCEVGWDHCEGACRDTWVDPHHCGTCNRSCLEGERCISGECACREGLIRCAGACVDPSSDARNCGGCDAPCSGATPYCAGSACTTVACADQPSPTSSCGLAAASCVPVILHDEHPLHCGACDVRCAADEICVGGTCRGYAPRGECAGCPCAGCSGDICCDSGEIGVVICLPDSPSCS